jgi:hypothetical protein
LAWLSFPPVLSSTTATATTTTTTTSTTNNHILIRTTGSYSQGFFKRKKKKVSFGDTALFGKQQQQRKSQDKIAGHLSLSSCNDASWLDVSLDHHHRRHRLVQEDMQLQQQQYLKPTLRIRPNQHLMHNNKLGRNESNKLDRIVPDDGILVF